jgi:hypothetical protein
VSCNVPRGGLGVQLAAVLTKSGQAASFFQFLRIDVFSDKLLDMVDITYEMFE